MKQYIGTKIINALPMTRLAYNELRGWDLPQDENGEDEGFLVEYLDDGQANHPDYAGYISWSPKEVFEKAYVVVGEPGDLPDHLMRVKAEAAQLNDRLSKLKAFFETRLFAGLKQGEKFRLQHQAVHMENYLNCLMGRIEDYAFSQGGKHE